MRRDIFICVLLAAITLACFWPAGRLGFTIYDDDEYVVKNPHIQAGITAESVGWAFTTTRTGNWHPVTWLSHMLDCQLFGLKPGGHHWMNLGFHIANTLLLFVVLRKTTGAVWRSALAAALFAVHPLHIQSVAWVSERKDVLSAFFFLLTLWAWMRYVKESAVRSPQSAFNNQARTCQVTGPEKAVRIPHVSRFTFHTSLFYWLALVFFALGLMAKPMLVTLPVILLLLDFWPLERVTGDGWRVTRWGWPVPQPAIFKRLLFEKLPFLALSLASSLVTMWAQNTAGSVIPLGWVPWDWRIKASLASYAAYLEKFVWPEKLAVFYPYTQIPSGEVFVSALLLIALSGFCLWRSRRQPWLLAGWLWFLVMLLPVIGLVQTGMQSMADRYTYLPSIGLFIMVAWGMAGIASLSKLWRNGMAAGAGGLLLAGLLVTRFQLGYWQNSVTLFSRALEITGDNPMGNYFLGNAFCAAGKLDEAIRELSICRPGGPGF